MRYDPNTWDVVISGIYKKDEGKGMRAFFNSVVLIALHKTLHDAGFYKIPIMFIDTPTLGLDESDTDSGNEGAESLRNGIMEYIVNHQNDFGQVILIENDKNIFNESLFTNVHQIRFGNNSNCLRPGFLLDFDN